MEKDAMDPVIGDAEKERREWSVLPVKDDPRLSVKLVDLGDQFRCAGSHRRNERRDLPGAAKRGLQVANATDTSATGATISDHYCVFGQYRHERVKISRGRGLHKRGEQTSVRFGRRGKHPLFLGHVLPGTFEELS